MTLVNKFLMFHMAVNDMAKEKEFYVDALGLEVTKEYRKDDQNWWVSLKFPEGGASINLASAHENMQPGTMKLYLSAPDVAETHQALSAKDIQISDLKDNLYGPGSGVKWFNLKDPEGNQVFIVQA